MAQVLPSDADLAPAADDPSRGTPSKRSEVRAALVTAVPAWIASRLLTVVGLLIATAVAGGELPHAGEIPHARGWWGWDGAWYRIIAAHGYASSPHGVRFFPLFPLLGRFFGNAFGDHDGIALVVLSNVAALGYATGIVLLARRELGPAWGRRSVWLAMLAPGAAVLALAYTEPLSGLLSVGFLLAVRSRRHVWLGVPLGLLAGLTRPTGVLLGVVAAVELAVRWRRPATPRLQLALAGLAPALGAASFCLWSLIAYGNALLPYTTQTDRHLRGTLIGNPLHGLLATTPHGGFNWEVNLAIAALVIALLVVVWRRLPPSIALWATLLAVAALTAVHATSLPRYLSTDFPLLLALALVARRRAVYLGVLLASATIMVTVAVVGFGGGIIF